MAKLNKISLFSFLNDNRQLNNLNNNKDVNVSSIDALAILTAMSFHDNARKMFFLFPTIYEAERFAQILGDFLFDDEVFIFPYDDIFRTSAIGVSPEMLNERLAAIASIFDSKPSIIIAHASSSLLHLMPKERYQNNILEIRKNDFIDLEQINKRLSKIGYSLVDRVTVPNQYALRGGILDIFDASYPDPLRIEFFGDEIDDIRMFKVNDEMSYKHIDEVNIHPGSLRLISDEEMFSTFNKIDSLVENSKISDRLAYDDLLDRVNQLKDSALRGYISDIDSRFYSLFNSDDCSILSYLEEYIKYVYDPLTVIDNIKDVKNKEKEYFKVNIKQNNSLDGEKVFINSKINFDGFNVAKYIDDETSFVVRETSFKAPSYAESIFMLNQYKNSGYKINIVLPEPNLSNVKNYLSEKGFEYTQFPDISNCILLEDRISNGFELPAEKQVFLSAKEIFGISDQHSRFLSRYKEAKIIRKYEDLQVGDYVVHEVHGVGKYEGVQIIDGLEYLRIKYADDGALLLPLNQYKMIRKYSSREGYQPTLDKIGGSTWSRKKSKIRSRITYLADQLLAIYAERKTRPGFAFLADKELEDSFQNSFSYPYTPSQLAALKDVRMDMEANYPMDRLIAGDVGFGKTEIAFNAAFKAIISGKQVAMLCPTTILCMQHYKVALQRFESFGINICAFNRFMSKKDIESNIEKIKNGEINFVIGTHKLLSDDIKFKDLGLLIIDEEQKFGVSHKEKIKDRAKNIDCLTITATPIPRTMQMSLLNIRSLSLLETPPVNRMPVKTYVVKYDFELIKEVISKELDRKGQIYYLHNDIATIVDIATKIQKAFPEKNVEIVHAQMKDDRIERIMNNFYAGNIDILVCTSIIESGLDIPNVNTIIVENADRFGLSQLYQIKGRVGRSDRLAYAYFLFKDAAKITDDGKKRLQALKDFTELGSGYKIAMQDLNIRGAGDILGSEQAGFVDSLGYDAYIELLNQVVREKQLQVSASEERKHDFMLSFSLDAHIPSSYGNEAQRITMYRELSDCDNDEQISNFAKKIRDVYGPYSEEVGNLLVKKKIENNLNNGFYTNFIENLGAYTLVLSDAYSAKPYLYKKLEELLRPMFPKLRVHIVSNHFEMVLTKSKEYLNDLLYLTEAINKAYMED